jgi:hypothetical protein
MYDDAENLTNAGTDVRLCSDALCFRKNLHVPLLALPTTLLRRHGEKKSHGRGATCSGRIQRVQERDSPRERQYSRQKKAIDKAKKDQNTALNRHVL